MFKIRGHCCVSIKQSFSRISSLCQGKANNNYLFPICSKYLSQIAASTFSGEIDRFNGITVDLDKDKCNQEQLCRRLDASLKTWRSEGRRCIWFKVNIKDSFHVPSLAERGFNFHHARDDFVMMYKWLPTDSDPNLPPASYTNLGVGALVFNKTDQLLVVSEKNYDYAHWKLPGGYVERGEDLIDAAVREVKEETGITCTFESLVTFRHTNNMMFGNSDIYVLMRMKALNENIVMSTREVNACKWMDVEEYTNHPHVHALNKLIVKKALQYKERNIKLSLEKLRVQWSTFTRDMNYLVIEDLK